jgi:hypothetical protein
MRRRLDERFAKRQAMCSTKRVLPQPVGPFSITGNRSVEAA